MKISSGMVHLLLVCLPLIAVHAHAAEKDVLNLVKPIVAPLVKEAHKNDKGGLVCEDGFVLQKNGSCCPTGTNNDLWSSACPPIGIIKDQIFTASDDTTRYCPSADMFIVSDKNRQWFSCASSNSSAMYTAAKGFEGSTFCVQHSYGYLVKIKPWGTVGCIKIGDSQGDGCIEAGTCSFGGK